METLQQWSDFQAAMNRGRMVRTSHFALHQSLVPANASTGPGFEETPALFAAERSRLGILIPKRWAKRAVTRNLIRRQVRHLVGDFEADLPVADYVVRLKSGFDARQFVSAASPQLKKAVRDELQQLFGKLAVPR